MYASDAGIHIARAGKSQDQTGNNQRCWYGTEGASKGQDGHDGKNEPRPAFSSKKPECCPALQSRQQEHQTQSDREQDGVWRPHDHHDGRYDSGYEGTGQPEVS